MRVDFVDHGNAASKAWVGDFLNRETMVPAGGQLAATGWTSEGQVRVVLTAEAAAAATTLAVEAVSGAIPDNTLLDFGTRQARVNGAVAAGATSITVDALPATIADDSVATYDPDVTVNVVPAGTLVGRTNAEKLAAAEFGPAADGDDEVFITLDDLDLSQSNRVVNLYRHGSTVKYNYLPSWAGASTALRNKLHASYLLIAG